tara:strand:- start:19289 stop:19750 length:462 start_codon:yes stop_codon:yes gene_type:complete
MLDLRELYQEVILDHGKSPRNFGQLEDKNTEAHGHNPLCGDTITIYLHITDEIIKDIRFEGKGCAISLASASMMTELLKGKTTKEASKLFGKFHALVAEDKEVNNFETDNEEFEKLHVLAGVKEYPMRVKCATLPWHTFKAAVENNNGKVSTE